MNRIEVRIADYASEGEGILALRERVFVGEQKVDPELEIDGLDPDCLHAIATLDSKVVACGRLQADGHIGRVAVRRDLRKRGIGTQIMDTLEREARARKLPSLWLSSQASAIEFYQRLGYRTHGVIYVEAGIDHIKMEKRLRSPS